MFANDMTMQQRFDVGHLDARRLLAEWRWLCSDRMTLIARNAFGDLFLRNEQGAVFQLRIGAGKLDEESDERAL